MLNNKGSPSPYLDAIIKDLEGWDYVVTSEITGEYNCIAYAADDNQQWWWPDAYAYWPCDAPREETVDAFVKAYGTLGYTVCQDEDSYDPAYDKIAIYAHLNGRPTHAAKQLDGLYWSSKLGELHDIKHPLRALEQEYGCIAVFLRRPKRKASEA